MRIPTFGTLDFGNKQDQENYQEACRILNIMPYQEFLEGEQLKAEMEAELDDWQSRFDASLTLPDWLTPTGSYKLTGDKNNS